MLTSRQLKLKELNSQWTKLGKKRTECTQRKLKEEKQKSTEIENDNLIERIREIQSWFFVQLDKIKRTARLIKKKEKRQTSNIIIGEGSGTHSSALAWKIPRTEEPGRLQSMGPRRVGHN